MLFDLTTIDGVFVVQYFQCVNNPKAKLILLKQCGKKQAEGNRPRLKNVFTVYTSYAFAKRLFGK